MNSKFNPKKYLGKNKVYTSLPGHTGISKIYVWNDRQKSYQPPRRGKCYLAKRYEYSAKGEKKRVGQVFDSLDVAIRWKSFDPNSFPIEKKAVSGTSAPNVVEESYTFAELFEDFVKHRFPLIREGSRGAYLKYLTSLKFFFPLQVSEISPETIDRWFDWLKSEGKLSRYQPTRIGFSKEVDALKSILNWHIGSKDNPEMATLPFLDRHKQMMRLKPKTKTRSSYMTAEEVEIWFEQLRLQNPNLLPAAITQVNQLLRISEVMAMKWENLNLLEGTYRVCEHVVWSRRKGGKTTIELGTKNLAPGDSYEMPLRSVTVELLKSLQKDASCDLIFHKVGKVWSYRQIQYAYNQAFKKAGLPYSSTHVCRYTGATQFLHATGGDYLALQQMGNWSDLQQALHYGKALKGRAKQAVRKADQKSGDLLYLKKAK